MEKGTEEMAEKKTTAKAAAASDERKKALEAALQQIERNYGKGAVMRLGQHHGMQIDSIPTGSMALDAALGVGGLPRGRIIEIYGPEASGKPPLHCMRWRKHRKKAAKRRISTWNTRWIPCTRVRLA